MMTTNWLKAEALSADSAARQDWLLTIDSRGSKIWLALRGSHKQRPDFLGRFAGPITEYAPRARICRTADGPSPSILLANGAASRPKPSRKLIQPLGIEADRRGHRRRGLRNEGEGRSIGLSSPCRLSIHPVRRAPTGELGLARDARSAW